MKTILAYKPQDYAYKTILLQFAEGKPLSCDTLNFLSRYQYQFTHPALDAVCNYYLQQYKTRRIIQEEKRNTFNVHPEFRFALPSYSWTKDDVEQFQMGLDAVFKKQQADHIEMKLTGDVYNRFKALTFEKMIYIHGYRLGLHESFFPGWYPYSVYFQWADVFGVAQYNLISEKGLTKTIVTLYLEPRRDRLLEECVQDYLIKNHLAFKPAYAIDQRKENKKTEEETHEETMRNQFTPQLTLSRSKEIKDENK